MRVLLLSSNGFHTDKWKGLTCGVRDIELVTGGQVANTPSSISKIDAIVGAGDFSNRADLIDPLIRWRTHPHSYLVPCWITTELSSFYRMCLWPPLSIDHFTTQMQPELFCAWVEDVERWRQNRMQLPTMDSFHRHSVLELITSLALRRASGRLLVFDEEGADGFLHLNEGNLIDASIMHFQGEEAFYELLTWTSGSYLWEPHKAWDSQGLRLPLYLLVSQGLGLIREANLLYHFLPDMQKRVVRTGSQSALDDGGVPFFTGMKLIYELIDGKLPVRELIEASPLPRPRAMSCLVKWLSFGDIALAEDDIGEAPGPEISLPEEAPPLKRQRLLIVDDSRLMCRALESAFSIDQRFDIVGMAHDGVQALELIEREQPDVVTLDMQMPRMDGLTVLKHVMIREPRPVVVLSSFTKETSKLTYDSIRYGAVSVYSKPSRGTASQLEADMAEIVRGVYQAACVRMEPVQYIRRKKRDRSLTRHPPAPRAAPLHGRDEPFVAISCGAGGLPSLIRLMIGISRVDTLTTAIICLDMSRRVIEALVPNLLNDCAMDMEVLLPGAHLRKSVFYFYSSEDCIHLSGEEHGIMAQGSRNCRELHQPVDHLFTGVADLFGRHSVVAIVSGTGEDGLAGVRYVKQKGGRAFVLSPDACLSPDLPRKVLSTGLARELASTAQLASLIEECGIASP